MGKTRIRLAMAAAAIPAIAGMAIAAPAMAFAGTDTDLGQHEHAGQFGGSQHATSTTLAPQKNDASNLSILSDGDSGVVQADPNNATSEAGNSSDTDQWQSLHEHAWVHEFFE